MSKKVINTLLLVCVTGLLSFQKENVKQYCLKSAKVKAAYKTHWAGISSRLKEMNVNSGEFDLFIRAFKHEGILEAWVKNRNSEKYLLYKTFVICSTSGILGPKRKQGDLQVPEGFYDIPSLHPYSNYHLALKVGYPNASDRIKSGTENPGGDIMIHGKCVTIGCLPLQDKPIEELFLLTLEAMSGGQKVKCHIFPFRLSQNNLKEMSSTKPQETVLFWEALKKGYDYFELNHSLPQISTDKKGNYQIKYAA